MMPRPFDDASEVVEDLAILVRGPRRDLTRAYKLLEGVGEVRVVHWESGSINAIRFATRRT